MKFIDYIKNKRLSIGLLIFALITIEIFLMIYSFGNFVKIYIPTIILLTYFIGIFAEYLNKKRYYENVLKILNELDEKYLITEIIKTPNFAEGKIQKEIKSTPHKFQIRFPSQNLILFQPDLCIRKECE